MTSDGAEPVDLQLVSGSPRPVAVSLVQSFDPGQQIGPSRGIRRVVGPHEPFNVDPMPEGSRLQPVEDLQLIRIVGCLDSMDRHPQGRLGFGNQE
jgi:hypothetical protein